MPKTKNPNYSIYDLIIMSQEDAGKVLYDECKKKKPNVELIQNILEHTQVNVNLQDENGKTPLMYVINDNNMDIFRMLIEKPEIDLNITDRSGYAVLHYASSWGCVNAVKSLLERPDLDLTLRDGDDRTALDCAHDGCICADSDSEYERCSKIYDILDKLNVKGRFEIDEEY